MAEKTLIMYARTYGCPFVSTARRVLDESRIPYTEIMINMDENARRHVIEWTGFESVPTLVMAEPGEVVPYETPAYLEKGHSPRGIDRGSIITEPNADQLKAWLLRHGLIQQTA